VAKEIQQLIGQDELLRDKFEKISKIKGVGYLTFASLVAETGGFALFENQRQLVSYAGYDVVEHQSGKRQGRTRISKKGNSRIRRALHMPALSAVRYKEPILAALYERVYDRSGIKMKAYVAVQKKLLCLIYTLWKKDTAFEANYHCKTTSSNNEPKSLFPVVFEENQVVMVEQKEVAPTSRATQDELPCNKSPEALFPVEQMY
jgi:transposase